MIFNENKDDTEMKKSSELSVIRVEEKERCKIKICF